MIVGLSRNRTPFTFVDHLDENNIWAKSIFTKAKSYFCHISKTVKPKNDFLFFFESSCDSEHINIDPESIWIQNAVCRRVRSFWLVILFRVLGGDLCKKEEHFYVLESSIVIVGLSRNRTPFTFVAHFYRFFINWPNIRKMI